MQIAGKNLIALQNAAVHCTSHYDSDAKYRVRCDAMVVDENGVRTLAAGVASGFSVRWLSPRAISGATPVDLACNESNGLLSYVCDFSLPGSGSTLLQIALETKDIDTNVVESRSDDLLLSRWTNMFGNMADEVPSEMFYKSIQFADLNGDGKKDICGRFPDGIQCALTQGTSFGSFRQWSPSFSDEGGWNLSAYYWDTIQFADLNGDGKADICGRAGDGYFCARSNGTSFEPLVRWTFFFGDDSGWHARESYWRTIKLVDLNADGRADVCGRASDGVYCALSTGNGFSGATRWTSEFNDADGWMTQPSRWQTVGFPDLNGDGKADICGRGANGMICGLSTGSTFASTSPWTTFFSDADGWLSNETYWGTLAHSDVNGDGKADFCGRMAEGMYCVLSDGNTFGPAQKWSPSFSDVGGWHLNPYYWGTIQLVDLNGDAKVDICGRASDGIHCSISNGTSFVNLSKWVDGFGAGYWIDDPAYWNTIQFINLEGLGKMDVCGRGLDGIYCSSLKQAI